MEWWWELSTPMTPRAARPTDVPLAGARVVLRATGTEDTTKNYQRHYEAISDEAGQYSIKGVRPGTYIAQAIAGSHYPATAEIEVVTQEKTLQDFHLEMILITKGAVAGTVTGVTQGLENPVPLEDGLGESPPRVG